MTGILGASGGYDEGHLIAADDSRRFCGVATFLKAPLLKDVAEPTVGFVGIPFDGGSSRTGGAQFGPRGVREASFRVSGYNAGARRSPLRHPQSRRLRRHAGVAVLDHRHLPVDRAWG